MRADSYTAVLLSAFLIAGSIAPAAQPAPADAHRTRNREQLTGDTRIVHTLNRFTFGPRPGDIDAVRAQGLDAWFERQLHPASIDNAALEVRLPEYPAMQRDPAQLLESFPSNAVIRQVMQGKAPLPEQGILRTVYQNQLARQQAKRDQKLAPESDNSATPFAMANETSPPASEPPASEPLPSRDAPNQLDSQQLSSLPPRERVLRLASLPQPELDALLKSLSPAERHALLDGLTPDLRETVGALEAPERTVVSELLAARLTRDIYSDAQLQEVMTDFWLNHFNVFLHKNEQMPYLLVSYERDVIRPRALGNFEDLLEAVAHSPAMLLYLDQAESTGPASLAATHTRSPKARAPEKRKRTVGLNENYARELMELHTLGVNGGYRQADVLQAARILTGWTVDRPQRGGGFRFDESRHEPGTKQVMGHKFKDTGEGQGRDLLHFLATRSATGQFIARKLAVRFVSDDPPQPLVDRLAKAFASTHGNIAAVLRALYHSPEFWNEDIYRAKVKTPLEFVVSAARATNADVRDTRRLVESLRQMGMPLYGCVPPSGYKQDAADWVSTGALVDRMNFALGLSAGKLPGVSPHWPSGEGVATESNLEQALVAGGVSDATRKAVLDQLAQQNGAEDAMQRRVAATQPHMPQALLAGLLLGSPEFQRR